MRRTNRVPHSVFWSCLLGLALASPARAQQAPAQIPPQPAPAKDGQPGARGNVLFIPINGTQRVQMSTKRPIDKVLNPKENVLRVQPILGDPTSVLVTGLDTGMARITLIGEGNVQENIDVVVQFDVEYLRTLLARVVPTASVQPVPGSNGTVILTGWVGHAEDIDVIMRTAVSVVGDQNRVVNAMHIGGVMQVQLDAVVARVNRTALRAMGFNLVQSGPSAVFGNTIGQLVPIQTVGTTPPSTFSNNGAGPTMGSSGGGSSQSGLITGGVINASPGNAVDSATNLFLGVVTKSGSFFGFLQALRQEGLAKLLSEPRLVTLSGQPASLLSGGKQAIPQPGGLGTVSVELVPFGTSLNFIPIVLGNGRIHLEIQTYVSQLDNASGTTISGTFVPGRIEQSARTIVEIEDGQTLAIGGLIQHEAQALTDKVPILGDLPYIGTAFSRKSFTDVEEELVIMVTPHLVDPMACNQLPKLLPGQETRTPDDYELFLEGILEAPRGPRVPFPDRHFVPAYKNGPTAALYPCASDGSCAKPGPKLLPLAGDSTVHANPLPLGNLEAKPVVPVAATPPANAMPPANPVEATANAPAPTPSPEPATTAEQNKTVSEPAKPATLPDALPGPTPTGGK